jgi:hypothetical protein
MVLAVVLDTEALLRWQGGRLAIHPRGLKPADRKAFFRERTNRLCEPYTRTGLILAGIYPTLDAPQNLR